MTRVAGLAVLLGCLTGCYAHSVRPATLSPKPVTLTARAGAGWTWLSWTPVGGASLYSIYRAETSAGPWRLRAATHGTSFTDKRVKNGVAYSYAIRVKSGAGLGPYSRVVSVRPAGRAAPKGLPGPPPADPADLIAVLHSQAGSSPTPCPAAPLDCCMANVRGGEACMAGAVHVASYLPNDIGAYDMIGNVWEWTADYYDEQYYRESPVTSPTGPATGQRHVRRGGAWTSDGRAARPDNRAVQTTGFR